MVAIVSDFRRDVASGSGPVRAELLRALTDLGYALPVSQLTRIEATRGSKLGAAVLLPRKMPVRIAIDITPLDSGCRLEFRMEDGLDSPLGRSYGVNGVYEKVFTEAQQRIDAALATLGGATSGGRFDAPTFTSTTPSLGLVERANAAVGRGEAAAASKVGSLLDGSAGARTGSPWKGLEQVWFARGTKVAVMSLAEAETHLAIAAIVAGQPGSLPANLASDLERFATGVERTLSQAPPGEANVVVSDAERPILEFMHTQVRIRDSLPVRTLHRCRDCRFEKITNPDYERLMERNRKLRSLASAAGATISSGGIRPFVVVGALFRLKRLDPSYTCPRCQAMEADESLATFCPTCGDLRREAVLRTCPKCHHDFVAALPREDPPFWADAAELTEPTAPPTLPGDPHEWLADLPPPTQTPAPAWPPPGPRRHL